MGRIGDSSVAAWNLIEVATGIRSSQWRFTDLCRSAGAKDLKPELEISAYGKGAPASQDAFVHCSPKTSVRHMQCTRDTHSFVGQQTVSPQFLAVLCGAELT